MSKHRDTLLSTAVLVSLRTLDAVQRRTNQLAALIEATALAGMSDELLRRLTIAVYDSKGAYKSGHPLFDWESAWFATALPKAPARLLIGGAGSGREVFPLAEGGYEILAFDPAPRFVRSANQRLGGRQGISLVQGSYEDLISERPTPLQDTLRRGKPFDAVLLGWASFTHIVEEHTRVTLLKELKELCPKGPVLLSFWSRPETTFAAETGRTAKVGARIAKLISGTSAPKRRLVSGDRVVAHGGFVHSFSASELSELSARAGYTVSLPMALLFGTTYPHATLMPCDS